MSIARLKGRRLMKKVADLQTAQANTAIVSQLVQNNPLKDAVMQMAMQNPDPNLQAASQEFSAAMLNAARRMKDTPPAMADAMAAENESLKNLRDNIQLKIEVKALKKQEQDAMMESIAPGGMSPGADAMVDAAAAPPPPEAMQQGGGPEGMPPMPEGGAEATPMAPQ